LKIKELIKAAINKGIIPSRALVPVLSFVRHIKPRGFVFNVHLADHCNLNCKCCDNFSPLADEVFLDFEQYEKDCKRLAFLTNAKVNEICLLGGEPLLNPQVMQIIETTRNHFPKTSLSLATNGILLPKQPEKFWECCRKNKVKIIVTKYPIKLDCEKIAESARNYGVKIEYWGGKVKTSYHFVLDLEGKHSPKKSFKLCYQSNVCIVFSNGRFYTCPTIPFVRHFNNHFKQNLEVSDADSIDIYKVESIKEIKKFLSKPAPFCRYCAVEKIDFAIPWGVSKKDISEWT